MTQYGEGNIDQRYSGAGAPPTPLHTAKTMLDSAGIYWLSTVRKNGQPHVTPLIGVVIHDEVHFTTGAGEQKAKNLETNPHCVITTGCNAYADGLDIVLEGEALRVTDAGTLALVAEAFQAKYDWHFQPAAGGFTIEDAQGLVLVFALRAEKALAFARGGQYSQTTWHIR